MLPVQQHDVEIVRVGQLAQLVDFGLWIDTVVRSDFGHQPVAVARDALQRNAQHPVHVAIRFGCLKEADAAIVGISHQAVELILAQVALHFTAHTAGPERQARHLDVRLAKRHPISGGSGSCLDGQAGCARQRGSGKPSLQESTSGAVIHVLPPARMLTQSVPVKGAMEYDFKT